MLKIRFGRRLGQLALLTALAWGSHAVKADDVAPAPTPSATPDSGDAIAADESEPSTERLVEVLASPEDTDNLAFAPYLDHALLAQAWQNLDAELLTDAALRLAEGETVLLRQHRQVTALQLLRLALKIADMTADKSALNRIATFTRKSSDPELQQLATAAQALVAASRAPDPIQANLQQDGSAAEDALVKSLLVEIQRARVISSTTALDAIATELPNVGLTADSQAIVSQAIAVARKEIGSANPISPEILDALGDESRSTVSTAAITGAINGLAKNYILTNLGTFEGSGSDNWGNRKTVVITKIPRITKTGNDGLWTKWTAYLDNPRDNLQIEVRDFKKASKNSVSFQVYTRLRARADYQAQYWKMDVKVISASFKARADVKCWVNITVAITPSGGTKFTITATSTSSDIKYENLVFDKFGAFGGATAELLGRIAESAFRGWFSSKYQGIRDSIKSSIRKACTQERDIYIPIKRWLGV